MKKTLLLGGAPLALLALASCGHEDYADWAPPQSNPQESAITLPGFSAMGVGAIDLAEVEDGACVQAFTLSVATLPEGAAVGNTRMELTPADGTLSGAVTIGAEDGRVAKEALQEAVETFWGKRPTARDLNAQVYSDIIIDGQSFLVDAGTVGLTVTPEAPFISTAYYLVGDMCGWDEGSMIPFNHSGEDVYADPVFTVTFTTEPGKYWKIIPQSNIDSGDFWHEGADGVVGVAVDGDTSTSGTLYAGPGVNAGRIDLSGNLRMTINMMDYTYTIEEMAGEYYMTGNPNGWASDLGAMFFPTGGNGYSYTTYYTGSWDLKFWSLDEVGDWDNIYGCPAANDNDGAWSGTILHSGGDQGTIGCISSPTAGYYTLAIDMGSMTYTWTLLGNQEPVEHGVVSITGDFNGWGDYVDMAQVAPHNWYAEATIPSGGGLKFLCDHDWAVNWGADVDVSDDCHATGVQDGSNITVPAGKYRIYLNDITGQFAFMAE